jgi:dihydroorotase
LKIFKKSVLKNYMANKFSCLKNRKLLIKNARLFCPKNNLDIANAFLISTNGVIESFGDVKDLIVKEEAFDQVIDAKGKLLTAGFLDIQVHLRDPGQTHKEDIISGSKAAVFGGITTVVCQPNTAPTVDSITILDYIKYKSMAESFCDVKVYASVTKSLAGLELCDLQQLASHELVVGFTDDGLPVNNPHFMRLAFEFSDKFNFIVAQHAEDHHLSNKGCMNEGEASASIGVRGIPNISESSIVARDIEILRYTGGYYHVLHVSCKETLELVKQAKAEGLNITCEVSPHHMALNDTAVLTYGTNAKMNPPLRSEADRLALIEGLKQGHIDAIATDHAPHDITVKNKDLESAAFGIIGLESMLAITLSFVHDKTLSLEQAIALLTYKPAKVVKLSDRGAIEKGLRADLAITDINEEWFFTKEYIKSKCYNTPFLNNKYKGKVKMTIVEGSIAFKDDNF